MDPRRPRLARLLLVLPLALSLAACGLAGSEAFGKTSGTSSGTPSPAPDLTIATATIPSAPMGMPYPATRFEAVGAVGTVSWTLVTGRLPEGMTLSSAGLLAGTPAEEGLFDFGLLASDGVQADSRTYTLSIGVFGLRVDGLRFGDAWAGTPVTLTAVGRQGAVRFDVVACDSGGRIDQVDETAGTAVYLPGTAEGACEDLLRATDLSNGATCEVMLQVMPHPAPQQVAEFGASDVWYVSAEGRYGTHPFARDFDAALNAVGLRSATGTTAEGQECDALAALIVRRAMLARVNEIFGRNADGSRGTGLAISFPFDRPSAEYAAPVPGTWTGGAADRYCVISLVHGSNPGVVGTAFLDSVSNALVENDTTAPGVGELGVFANRIAPGFNAMHQSYVLPDAPVGPTDVDALRAILYGQPFSGFRHDEIKRIAEAFGDVLARVVAHEIGHSLGLGHTNPYTPGSVMNATLSLAPDAECRFLQPAWDVLQGGLPGPGRTGTSGRSLTESLPAGGVEVCNLVLEDTQPEGCGCCGR